jgi:hypothetical protein
MFFTAEILEVRVDLVPDVVKCGTGDLDAARFRNPFETGRDIDCTVGVAALGCDIIEVDADAQEDEPSDWQIAVRGGHAAMQFDSELHGTHRAAELDQHLIAHQLYYAAMVLGN